MPTYRCGHVTRAKYGDNFVYLKLDPEKGIMGAQQLPNIEIEHDLERGMTINTASIWC